MAKKKKEKNVLYGPSKSEILKRVIFAAVLIVAVLLVFLIGIPALKGKIREKRAGMNTQAPKDPAPNTPAASKEKEDTSSQENDTYTPKKENLVYEEDADRGYVNNIVILYVQEETSPETVESLADRMNGSIVGHIESLRQYQVEVPPTDKEALEALCTQLEAEAFVVDARIDGVSRSELEYQPDDKWGSALFFQETWDEAKPDGKNWHLEAVKVPSAWNLMEQEQDRIKTVPIGVVDVGIYDNHEDLRISKTADAVMVEHFHGTHVAGIAGAVADNKKGLTGIAKDSPIYFTGLVKSEREFTNKKRTSFDVTDSRVESAISACLAANCRAVNLSVGSYIADDNTAKECAEIYTEMLCRMIHVYGKDFIIVQSAGNSAGEARYNGHFCPIDETTAEAAIQKLGFQDEMKVQDVLGAKLVVGAVDQKKTEDGHYQLAYFSNYGDQVDVCAPGVNIYSTESVNFLGMSKYGVSDGTSYSAPMITAITGLVWSANHELSAAQVSKILKTTAPADVYPYSGYKKGYEAQEEMSVRYGMIDACAAVQKALDDVAEEEKDPLEAYEDAVEHTTKDGEWIEHSSMSIRMGVNQDAATESSLVSCDYDLHVTDYSQEDPGAAKASGTAAGNVFGMEMNYDIEYADGVTTYYMESPFPVSYEVEGEMSVFDFSLISDFTVDDAFVKGQTMTFDLTQGAMPDGSFGFISDLAQMQNIEMHQAVAEVTVTPDGKLDRIVIDIQGSLVYEHESLDAAFTLEYAFED